MYRKIKAFPIVDRTNVANEYGCNQNGKTTKDIKDNNINTEKFVLFPECIIFAAK